MTLHENPSLFRQAIQATTQRMGNQGKQIPEIFVEKDYWVTLALHRIFHGEAKDFAIFKGGTALSKCHRLIERFSEDIDMVVVRVKGDNGNTLKRKLKSLSGSIEDIMPEIDVPGVTNKKGMIRKTVHDYPKQDVQGIYGQVGKNITIESSWLGTFEPHVKSTVSCYITEMMKATGQQALIAQYGMQPFEVQVLSKERTFCEKIMSLVRFSYTDNPYDDLSQKIRHAYDLNRMLENEEIAGFFKGTAFDDMLNIVGNDDVLGFKNNNHWLSHHPAEALIFKSPAETWEKIRGTYQTTFKDMVTGTLPPEQELVNTLKQIAERLKTVTWSVQPREPGAGNTTDEGGK